MIAMYLPQFHVIPENNMWWGEGYTEWDAVKEAVSYSEKHRQPRIPLEDNYYNLLEKSTMLWQVSLMKKYGIYGMCFYHYYFKEGKKVLERPAENLLCWKDIDMPFCFSWANETWARSWSKLSSKNVWNIKKEKKDGKEILIEQEYGTEVDWEKHFEYLIPFFKDERYIKYNNMPIFVIHNPERMNCIREMLQKWNEWAKDSGFDGIFCIGRNNDMETTDAKLQQEPNYSDIFITEKNKTFDAINDQILANAYLADDRTFLCATPGYDDTPRRGTEGEIIFDSTPEKFYDQLRALLYYAKKRNHEYMFINAWNEWGEGMYLEPDTVYKYGYLDAVFRANNEEYSAHEIESINERVMSGVKQLILFQKNKLGKINKICDTFDSMLHVFERNETFASKLQVMGYENVAVVGLGKIGRHLVNELISDGYDVKYGVDKTANEDDFDFPIYRRYDDLPEVDVAVVTIFDKDIVETLKSQSNNTVITIDELLNQK